MSNIAKVFIVINFVLSIMYMAIAGTLLAQKWDYRQMLQESEENRSKEKTTHELDAKNSEAKIENLKTRLRETLAYAVDFKSQFEQEKQKNEELKRNLDSFNQGLQKAASNIEQIEDRLKEKDNTIDRLQKELDLANKKTERAEGDKSIAEEQQAEISIALNNIKGESAEKEKIIQKQEKELKEAKALITAVKTKIDPSILTTSQKNIDGLITAVTTDPALPLVMLSKGADDGVLKGYQFTVYRGNTYVGLVTVEEVYKDAAAARIVKDMTVKPIQKGDSVTTRLR